MKTWPQGVLLKYVYYSEEILILVAFNNVFCYSCGIRLLYIWLWLNPSSSRKIFAPKFIKFCTWPAYVLKHKTWNFCFKLLYIFQTITLLSSMKHAQVWQLTLRPVEGNSGKRFVIFKRNMNKIVLYFMLCLVLKLYSEI